MGILEAASGMIKSLGALITVVKAAVVIVKELKKALVEIKSSIFGKPDVCKTESENKETVKTDLDISKVFRRKLDYPEMDQSIYEMSQSHGVLTPDMAYD